MYDLPLMDIYQPAGTKGYMKRGLDKIAKIFKNIADKDWKPTPSALCHWCEFCPTNPNAHEEFKYLCPYFSHWQSKGDSMSEVEYEWQGMENHDSVMEIYQTMRKKTV